MTEPEQGAASFPAAPARDILRRLRAGWLVWSGREGRPEDPDRHKHDYGKRTRCSLAHSHERGAVPHDHLPAVRA